MTDDRRRKLEEIFRVVLDLPPRSDVVSVRRLTSDRWDSLAHVSLVAAIESEFGVALDSDHTERLTSFQAAVVLLEEAAR